MATIPSIAMIPSGYKASKVYSVLPTDGAGDLTFSRAGALPSFNATRVNSDGLIEEVLSNVPRLDYSNGGCPSLLVEPQSTNLLLRSEEFDNIAWTKSASTIITANSIISPSGVLNADTITQSATNTLLGQVLTISTIGVYSYSSYIKKGNFDSSSAFRFGVYQGLAIGQITFDFSTGLTSVISGTFISHSATNVGNGWYRIQYTINIPTIGLTTFYNGGVGGNISNGAFFYSWGAQLEALPYATSYIPTVASTVTRVAETVSKTGISDLIGQTEGTVFLNTKYSASATASGRWFNVFGTTNHIGLALNGANSVRTIINGASDTITTSPKTNLGVKLAFAYNSLGVVLFINGVQYPLPNGGSQIITSLNSIVFDPLANPQLQTVDVNLLALWKERLSNETLTQLTTL
jgi:hypothetical protein